LVADPDSTAARSVPKNKVWADASGSGSTLVRIWTIEFSVPLS